MLRKQRTLAVWMKRWKESQRPKNTVVLTKMNLYRNFGTLAESWEKDYHHSMQQGNMSSKSGGRLKSRTGPTLLKSESEDSGVEMASSDHSPSTPPESEHSFFMVDRDGFHVPNLLDVRLEEEKGRKRSNTEIYRTTGADEPFFVPWSSSKPLEQRLFRNGSKKARETEASLCRSLQRNGQESEHTAMETVQLATSAVEENAASKQSEKRSTVQHSQGWDSLDEFLEACWTGDVVDAGQKEIVHPGGGLGYLEQVCRMLEHIARLQQENQLLQKEKEAAESRLRAGNVEECLCGSAEDFTDSSEKRRSHVDLASQLPMEEPFLPTHFRKRSSSDTRAFLNFGRSLDEVLPSPHFISTGNLLESLSEHPDHHTPIHKIEHKHWGKVRDLVSRFRKKAEKPAMLRQSSVPVDDNQPKQKFAPIFKKREKNLSVR
ncbi:uncharacterized protein LOC120539502 isoform X1 [Polypterus senegalus]|uniref:uncharacterized protein LOC120539502 isoform X1 n=2 Tax=Polypterus senegalus TaxID=55291 RepID=UPI00196686B5|nr:uncharacterized protein LOC120539502 isoform X1 [Polypterus senegalus]